MCCTAAFDHDSMVLLFLSGHDSSVHDARTMLTFVRIIFFSFEIAIFDQGGFEETTQSSNSHRCLLALAAPRRRHALQTSHRQSQLLRPKPVSSKTCWRLAARLLQRPRRPRHARRQRLTHLMELVSRSLFSITRWPPLQTRSRSTTRRR